MSVNIGEKVWYWWQQTDYTCKPTTHVRTEAYIKHNWLSNYLYTQCYCMSLDKVYAVLYFYSGIQHNNIMDYDANPAYGTGRTDLLHPTQTPIYSEVNKKEIDISRSTTVKTCTSRKVSCWLVVASTVSLATLVLVLCLGAVIAVLHSTVHNYNQDIQTLKAEVERMRNNNESLNTTYQLSDLQSSVNDVNLRQNLFTSQIGSLEDSVNDLLIDTKTNLTGYISSPVDLYKNCRYEHNICFIRPTSNVTELYWRFCRTGLGSTITLVSLYTC